LYFDIHGQALTWAEWGKLLVDEEYSLVARTELKGATPGKTIRYVDLEVCTLWKGINMGHSDGPIRIFETGIWLNPKQDTNRLAVQRYSTREEARAGHGLTVYNLFRARPPFAELDESVPMCVTCQERPIRERLRVGCWLCLECEVLINSGELVHPVAMVTV